MGNGIGALKKAMIEIETDGSKLWSNNFMGNIFPNIYDDGPLEPLTEFMNFMFGKWRVSSFYPTVVAVFFPTHDHPQKKNKHLPLMDLRCCHLIN
mmetsp:Transcript_19034/g.39936  ORF Transcript_19034/g.39936 Transcript_19034/m.39936 type:complete len:95 (+) Transcript_19034:607-891(+)